MTRPRGRTARTTPGTSPGAAPGAVIGATTGAVTSPATGAGRGARPGGRPRSGPRAATGPALDTPRPHRADAPGARSAPTVISTTAPAGPDTSPPPGEVHPLGRTTPTAKGA